MIGYSKVILAGNLTKSAELQYLGTGTALAKFSIAINKTHKDKEKSVSFFDIELYGNAAVNLEEYLTIGKPVLIEGRLKQDRWKDDNDRTRTKVKIIAERIVFLPNEKKTNGTNTGKQEETNPGDPEGEHGGNLPF